MPIPEIDVDELAERLAAGAPVFDVRQPDEYVAGHVPGAVLVPLADVPARVAEFPAAGPVLLICRSGARSLNAAQFLEARGLAPVNVAGGTLAWVQSGREIATGDVSS